MRNLNYDECLQFVEHKLRVKLYPYQKRMLYHLCNGEEFWAARGVGRSFVADCFGKYVAHVYDLDDRSAKPVEVFPYTLTLGLIYAEETIDWMKKHTTEDEFKRDFLCE